MTDGAQAGWVQRYRGALMDTFGPPKLVLARGEGARVWDIDGNEYLDLLGGLAVNSLGHAHPALVEAVSRQLSTLGHISNFFASTPQIELAERLLALLADSRAPGVGGRVFLTNSGTEANEAALKLTRRTGRTHLVAAEGSFHGRTMGALALTSKTAYREPFEPLPGEVTFVPYGDVAALAAAVGPHTAAVVLEPVQGEAGVRVPHPGYLAAARGITAGHGALLWLDEVQSGMGRTGTWFGHRNPAIEPALVRPDVVTLAKGLGGGIPVGACVAQGSAGELLQPGHHGTTFGGNPVACAAALAVIETIEREHLLDRAVSAGARLRQILAAGPGVSEVEGVGLLLGVELDGEYAADVVTAAQQAGVIVNSTGPRRVRVAPPLVVSAADLDLFADRWPSILASARKEVRA